MCATPSSVKILSLTSLFGELYNCFEGFSSEYFDNAGKILHAWNFYLGNATLIQSALAEEIGW